MKLLIFAMLSLGIASASATDLLEPREWKSSDGKPLKAELLRFDGEKVTLKREKDGRLFPIPLEKLSEEDRALIAEESKKIDDMAVKSIDQRYRAFVGLPDPDESVWDLAARLNRHTALWEAITQSTWQASATGSRLLKLAPTRMVREQDGQYLIEGDKITVRLIAENGYKINISGDKLIMISSSDARKTLAEKGKPFSPSAKKDDLVDCRFEKIGTRESLVMTFNVVWSRY